MIDKICIEDHLRHQLETRLAEYGITHLAIQDVRPQGMDHVMASLDDTRNHQAVEILIDRATGHFLNVDIFPSSTG